MHLPDLDGISYTFFLNLVYIQKETNTVTENSINFWGIYILASVQIKLCIFRTLEDEKQQKEKLFKKLDTSALVQKQPHRKLEVGGFRGEDGEFPGTQAASPGVSRFRWWRRRDNAPSDAVCCRPSPPPQTNLPQGGGGGGPPRGPLTALAKASSVHGRRGRSSVCRFHNFGYKVIRLKRCD